MLVLAITRIDEEVLAEITTFGDPEPIYLTRVTLTFNNGHTYVGEWSEAGLRSAYIRGRIAIEELEAALDRMPHG